jgi:hypothetical protein
MRGAVVAEHKILVVPSRWTEPFGIVALEGIASGCAVVASAKEGCRTWLDPLASTSRTAIHWRWLTRCSKSCSTMACVNRLQQPVPRMLRYLLPTGLPASTSTFSAHWQQVAEKGHFAAQGVNVSVDISTIAGRIHQKCAANGGTDAASCNNLWIEQASRVTGNMPIIMGFTSVMDADTDLNLLLDLEQGITFNVAVIRSRSW